MNGHSIAWLKEWLDDPDTSCVGEAIPHIRNLIADCERANGKDRDETEPILVRDAVFVADGPSRFAAAMADADEEAAYELAKKQGRVTDKPRMSFEGRMRDRYHFTLYQIEKVRFYLLRGQSAMAMDALYRAKDGIGE